MHSRCIGEPSWVELTSSWLTDMWTIIINDCCFKPLSYIVVCYPAIVNWYKHDNLHLCPLPGSKIYKVTFPYILYYMGILLLTLAISLYRFLHKGRDIYLAWAFPFFKMILLYKWDNLVNKPFKVIYSQVSTSVHILFMYRTKVVP